MLINCNTIETIEFVDEQKEDYWKYTSVIYWETSFFGRKKSINVDLKWYNLKDFHLFGILNSDKKQVVKEISQHDTDKELLNEVGEEKFFIKNKKLMIKPHIVITFTSGQKQKKFFDTIQDAHNFVEYLENNKLQDILIEL